MNKWFISFCAHLPHWHWEHHWLRTVGSLSRDLLMDLGLVDTAITLATMEELAPAHQPQVDMVLPDKLPLLLSKLPPALTTELLLPLSAGLSTRTSARLSTRRSVRLSMIRYCLRASQGLHCMMCHHIKYVFSVQFHVDVENCCCNVLFKLP